MIQGVLKMAGLRSLDLNLLTVFDAVVETRNITGAAERVGLSQSAVSHALGRLRESLGDQLFIRSRQGLTLTPVAEKLLPSVRQALDLLTTALSEPKEFDPRRSAQEFRIAIPHPMGPFIALRLQEVMVSLAPRVALTFDTRTLPVNLEEELQQGRFDLAIDWIPVTDRRFVNQHLFDDRIMMLIREGDPKLPFRPTAAWLEAQRFVSIHERVLLAAAPAGVRELRARFDWNISLRVSEFLEIPTVVAATELFGPFLRSGARVIARIGGLRMLDLPFDIPATPVLLIWHEARRKELAHTWLRRTVRDVVRRFAAEASDPARPQPGSVSGDRRNHRTGGAAR